MNKDKNAARARRGRKVLGWLLSFTLVFTALPQSTMLAQDQQARPTATRGPEYATKTPEQLQQLVAPYRVVSRFAGSANPFRCHVSRTSSRGRPMGASASRFQG